MKPLFVLATTACVMLHACSKDLAKSEAGMPDAYIGIGPGRGGDSTAVQPGVITAGEWNDLKHWDFWTNLLQRVDFEEIRKKSNYKLATRFTVKLISSGNQPLIDQRVEISKMNGAVLWEAHTNHLGAAELFFENSADTASFKVVVPGLAFSATGNYSSGTGEYQLFDAAINPTNADIAFVVDATGSMGDEISYLKTELLDVINRVQSMHSNIVLKTSSVFYRDQGDDYVTRTNNFTAHSESTINFIKQQEASGGGDFPEAVHSALEEAVQRLSWSAKARARIMFLVLDAPPHEDVAVMEKVKAQVKAAAQKGICIIPITASGIDKSTEFLMRQIAIATNGTYVFITNHSGIGDEHLEPTVGQYEVEFLNNLMVRLINQQLE